jgi:hypothetical protein
MTTFEVVFFSLEIFFRFFQRCRPVEPPLSLLPRESSFWGTKRAVILIQCYNFVIKCV